MIARCIQCGCILTDTIAKGKKLCLEHDEERDEQLEELLKFFKNFKGTNFIELIESFINSHYLVTFPGGKSHCSDIDSFMQKHGYFIFFEAKTFWRDEIEIKMPQFYALWELYTQLKRREVYIIGVDSNDQIDGDDYLWYIPLGKILEKTKKDDGQKHVHIRRDQMHKITRKEFNWYMNQELDLKSNPFYDPKEDALKKFRDGR